MLFMQMEVYGVTNNCLVVVNRWVYFAFYREKDSSRSLNLYSGIFIGLMQIVVVDRIETNILSRFSLNNSDILCLFQLSF